MPHLPGPAEAQRVAGTYGARTGTAGPAAHQVRHLPGEPACQRIPLRVLDPGPRNSHLVHTPTSRKKTRPCCHSPPLRFQSSHALADGAVFLFSPYFWRWEESDLSSGLSLQRAQEELERHEPLPQALHCHAEPHGRVTEAGTGPDRPTRRQLVLRSRRVSTAFTVNLQVCKVTVLRMCMSPTAPAPLPCPCLKDWAEPPGQPCKGARLSKGAEEGCNESPQGVRNSQNTEVMACIYSRMSRASAEKTRWLGTESSGGSVIHMSGG